MASAQRPGPLRRALDFVYAASGAFAAMCLACIAVVMLLQAGMREFGYLLRGADDIVAWLCAASAFFALGHTFRHGELVRVGLVLDHLPAAVRRKVETAALTIAVLFCGYMVYAVVLFVYESWKFNEVAQGLLRIPIWIPQASFALGVTILFIAVLDDFVAKLRGQTPAYEAAETEKRARKDFSESL
jgi:TRAP-type C4-dicarboxylate transport system permease small subunit